jgi:YhcH/YjgK/YiaL family protein
MILDTLSESHQYTAISPRFEKAFAFLRQVNKDTAPGRYDIDGEDIFAFVQQHLTKPIEERQYEAHRKYIDVQYIIRGREVLYWAPLPLLTNITMPFSEEQDAALYSIIPEGMPYQLREGQFTVLFPQDGHVPSCAWDQPAEVLKVVVKVKV